MNLKRHKWSHPVWRELQRAYRQLYRNKVFYDYAESVFRQKANDCNRRSDNGTIKWQELKELYEYVNGFCFWNARRGEDYTVGLRLDFEPDHYIPLNLGGTNTIDNIVLCTRHMNRRKGDKHPMNFLIEVGDADGELRRVVRLARKQHDLIQYVVLKQRQLTLDSLHNQETHDWLNKLAD